MLRKNIFKLLASIGLSAVLTLSVLAMGVSADSFRATYLGTEEIPFETYTYWEGLGLKSKTKAYCKPMYQPISVCSRNKF